MVRTDLSYVYCSSKKLAGGKYKDHWRFRRDGVDTALPGAPGDATFHARYSDLMQRADQLAEADANRGTDRHTFAFLCERYLGSTEFAALAPKTQDDYRRTIEARLVPVLVTNATSRSDAPA